MNQRTKLFISYSHEDVRWLNAVKEQLAVLEQEGLLDVFEDTKLQAGEDWYERLHAELSSARIGLLLVSAPFLGSGFIRKEEIPKLFEKHGRGGMLIYPLLVRPCPWEQVAWLSKLQMRPQDSKRRPKPISSHSSTSRDRVLADVATEIAQIIRGDLESTRSTGSSRSNTATYEHPSLESAASVSKEEAIRLRVEAESEDLIAQWPTDEELPAKIQSIIRNSYSPKNMMVKALHTRIEGQLVPVLNGLVKIETDLRSKHCVPFDDNAITALRERLQGQISRTWSSLVRCALLDAEAHVIHNLGDYPRYKEEELNDLAEELDQSTDYGGLPSYIENLIKKARADVILNARA